MTFRSTVLDLLCAQRRQMRLIVGVLIAMGLLVGLSATVVEPGDRVYPILVIDAVLVVAGLVFFGVTHYLCTKRAMEE
ncbi:hypothetical protein [Halobaculum lipolyticum]|uniref:Uncharacterized protein n=1 Tax=Halobaculum lipolyticum TaxID=3032001 RepID=A0ABD5WDR1_9EURY|nr:hypothetical protein [Halobaculum sp. DT31]